MNEKVFQFALVAGLMIGASTLFASEYLGAYGGFRGFYLGGAGTVNFTQAQTTPSVNYYVGDSSVGVGLNRRQNTLTQTKNELDGYAELGYAFVNQQHYYFGISLFGQTHAQKFDSPGYRATVTGNATLSHVSGGYMAKTPNIIGLKLSPGYLVSPNDLLYLNMGALFGNVEYTVGASYYEENGIKNDSSELPASKITKDAYGFIGGVGYEHLFAQHMGVFVAYNYSYLSSKAQRGTLDTASTDEREETYQAQFANSALSLGLRIRF